MIPLINATAGDKIEVNCSITYGGSADTALYSLSVVMFNPTLFPLALAYFSTDTTDIGHTKIVEINEVSILTTHIHACALSHARSYTYARERAHAQRICIFNLHTLIIV